MVNQLFATTALCAALLGASTPKTSAKGNTGDWSIRCEPNATFCRAAQFIADAENPKGMWIKVALYREGDDLRLVLLTPPLAYPRAHLTLDHEIETFLTTTGCTAERCEFNQILDTSEQKMLIAGRALDIEVALTPFETSTLTLDLDKLEEALLQLPIAL